MAWLIHCVACVQSSGQTSEQMDAMQATLDKFLHTHRKPTEPDTIAEDFAADVTARYGRDGAARLIALVARDRVRYIGSELYAARMVGRELEPEFTRAVFQTLDEARFSLEVGRLLILLRDARPEDAQGIAQWLSDTRPGDEPDLKNPKVREGGGTPYRVCDIACNVMNEIQVADRSRGSWPISRRTSIAEREEIIVPLRAQYPQRTLSAQEVHNRGYVSPVIRHTGVLRLSSPTPVAVNPASLPLTHSSGWQTWAIVSALPVLAACWLFFRWRSRKRGTVEASHPHA